MSLAGSGAVTKTQLVAVFVFCAGLLAAGLPAGAAQQGQDRLNQNNYRSYMLNLVNQDRATNGSMQVEENSKLDNVAQAYAEYLLRSGFFGHVDPFGRNPQDRANLYGINAGVSENLAWESSNYENPNVMIQRAEQSMMNEPPDQLNHRFNILNPQSRYVGIGIARSGDKVLMVQEFTQQLP